jgi:phosphohistidine swiveling domain-containing protein
MTYAKDFRDEYRRRGVCSARPLFGEIGKRMGITLDLVSYLTAGEIREFLTSGRKPDAGTVAERVNGFMLFKRNGELICASGADIARYAAEIGFEKKESMGKEVKGTIGSKGKATGRVRIVLVEGDLSKVSDGDVLVALTTNPAYTPAMSKAVAFVTDQGGITCHAAIVAREMGKPCIVGTQNATKVLKEGDLIEVDGDSGTVRKLQE